MGSATCRNCCRSTFSTQQGGSRHSAMSDGVSLLHQQTNKPANRQTSEICHDQSRQPRLSGPSGPEKCRGQGAATQTVRMYGKEPQRRHRHFLRPAFPARRFKFLRFNLSDLTGTHPGLQPSHHKKRQAPITGTCLERQPTA